MKKLTFISLLLFLGFSTINAKKNSIIGLNSKELKEKYEVVFSEKIDTSNVYQEFFIIKNKEKFYSCFSDKNKKIVTCQKSTEEEIAKIQQQKDKEKEDSTNKLRWICIAILVGVAIICFTFYLANSGKIILFPIKWFLSIYLLIPILFLMFYFIFENLLLAFSIIAIFIIFDLIYTIIANIKIKANPFYIILAIFGKIAIIAFIYLIILYISKKKNDYEQAINS